MTRSARTFSGRSSHSHFAPMIAPASSSAVHTKSSSPAGRQPSRARAMHAAASAATWSFMSCAPRPRTSPSATSPAHGEKVHSSASAGTVSAWPRRQRVGPSPSPRRRATRFGRSGSSAASSSHSNPTSPRRSASSSWTGRSRPGGFEVSIRISSPRRSTASAPRSDAVSTGVPSATRRRLVRQRAPVPACVPPRGDTEPMESRLFDTGDDEGGRRTSVPSGEAPLAVRMRPRALDELVGQDEVMRIDSPLRIAIESGEPHSAILYGPPGSGKTTLARIIAAAARGALEEESAVNAGRAQVRAAIERAEERRRASNQPTIFFLDEIHRFNKAQQDALLPAVEEGLLTLIGATTENPYFEVNNALLSRSRVYELSRLRDEHVLEMLQRALTDERGVPGCRAEEGVLEFLAARADGDGRTALGALEVACETAGERAITLQQAEDALQRKAVLYDTAAAQAVEHVGLPEAALNLAQAAVYLALAPKSNASYVALKKARAWVRDHGAPEIPMHLRYPGNPGEKSELGHGQGYDYPHDRPNAVADQEYLPERAVGTRFLDLTKFGFEGELRERYERILRGRGRT